MKKPESILITDDNSENLKVLSEILDNEGYEIRLAMDGEQALESIHLEPPDLILLDIQMPKMDGYDVCHQLKQSKEFKDIPIVFVSAMSETFNKVKAFQVGANDYISKPFHIEEVVGRVRLHLEMRMYRSRLEESNIKLLEQFKSTFEQAAVGICHTDPKTQKFLKVNNRLTQIYGYSEEELLNMTVLEVTHPDFITSNRKDVQDLLQGKISTFSQEKQYVRKDGIVIWARVTVSLVRNKDTKIPTYFLAIVEDISDRKKAEDELNKAHREVEQLKNQLQVENIDLQEEIKVRTKAQIQSEKMASLGQLTAGIAHEINNPVSFTQTSAFALNNDMIDIINLVEKYREYILNGRKDISEITDFEKSINYDMLIESVHQEITDIQEGTKRTSKIVKGLREFSYGDEMEMRPADINAGIENTLSLLNSRLKESIYLSKYYDSSIGEYTCHIGQLNQVFMNILTNALDAMNDKGSIEITTKRRKKSVVISIKDDGSGIPEKLIDKIFDPFFTTKPVGKGTGLGLSISHGIVEGHGGKIEVKSEVGKGSEFVITVPENG